MTSRPELKNPDMNASIPFGIKIQGSMENKRQLRNIDRSMKSITRLLKRNFHRNKTNKTELQKSVKVDKTKKKVPSRKPKVLIVMNNQNSLEQHLTHHIQEEPKQVKICNVASSGKSNKTIDNSVKTINLRKGFQAQYKNKSTLSTNRESSINSELHIKLHKVTRQNQVEEQEFYPNRLKRVVRTQENWLKPRTVSKTVCRLEGVIKRKMNTPRQGALQTLLTKKNVKPNYSELGMKELVRVVDDEGLSEEDFMEILTCPSPVWWEDQGDSSDEFIEDAIPYEILDESETKTIMELLPKEDVEENKSIFALKDIKVSTNDEKFMKKRSKLESLLGNIVKGAKTSSQSGGKLIEDAGKTNIELLNNFKKSSGRVDIETANDITGTIDQNTCIETESESKHESDKINNSDLVIDENLESSIEQECDISDDLDLNTDKCGINSNNSNMTNDDITSENKTKYQSKEDLNEIYEKAISVNSTDEESLTGSLYDEEILKNLEDMDIPIESNADTSRTHVATEIITAIKASKNEIKHKEKDERSLLLPNVSPSLESRSSTSHKNNSLLETSMDISSNIESSLYSKIIDNKKKLTEPETCSNEPIKEKSSALHRIENSNLDTPIGKIDSFYKKVRGFKSILRDDLKDKLSNQDAKQNACRSCNSESNKSLNVTNDQSEKVKYCYHCSSIFDTDKCNYCSNSSKNANIVPQCCSAKDVKIISD